MGYPIKPYPTRKRRAQQFTYLKGEDSPCLKRWRTLVLR